MREQDLQSHLYENPSVLFPGQTISAKFREYAVEGKRVDLLFHVEGLRYIVELKRDTIRRQDVGQVMEYYGRMRRGSGITDLRMILVAPSIPSYWSVTLEEFGIRCVEVPYPLNDSPLTSLVPDGRKWVAQEVEDRLVSSVPSSDPASFQSLNPPAGRESMAISHRFLRDSLASVIETYDNYQLVPIRMRSPTTLDILCFGFEDRSNSATFTRGGAWWAYAIGKSEQMPKNDLPNLSICAMPWGLDVTVNSELRTSQLVTRRRLLDDPKGFNEIVRGVGGLQFQPWLKLEHQPRFYHWIPLIFFEPETWDSDRVTKLILDLEVDFDRLRGRAIAWIRDRQPMLSSKQAGHMERMNRSMNLALRIVHPFQASSDFWNLSLDSQVSALNASYARLKPLVDFFHAR